GPVRTPDAATRAPVRGEHETRRRFAREADRDAARPVREASAGRAHRAEAASTTDVPGRPIPAEEREAPVAADDVRAFIARAIEGRRAPHRIEAAARAVIPVRIVRADEVEDSRVRRDAGA